jgi:hypothetical protein
MVEMREGSIRGAVQTYLSFPPSPAKPVGLPLPAVAVREKGFVLIAW